MFSLFRSRKSAVKRSRRPEIRLRKLRFDRLEERTLLTVILKSGPIDLGTLFPND
jgi:hypothetical protein